MVGGGLPDESGHEILINLQRMNKLRHLDEINATMTVDAGMVLQQLQDIAKQNNSYFPLSLASEGSCQIGGNISTNAGGVNVLRYGNCRDLVLGLEVVLADGSIYQDLNGLRKDNTGYDLKQLFIGAEGTLGIITAATVKLYPHICQRQTAFLAVPHPQAAIDLLHHSRHLAAENISSFELVSDLGLQTVLTHIPGTKPPLTSSSPWYVLLELTSPLKDDVLSLTSLTEKLFIYAMEHDFVTDGVLAQNQSQAAALWKLRESLSEAQKYEGGSIKHDISLPISHIPKFLEQAGQAVAAAMPGIRPVPFGHLGDGNLHYNLSQPPNMEREDFLAHWEVINRIVHDITVSHGGSISAEHGIGRLKRNELAHYKSPVDLKLMRQIKRALDPRNILNPDRVIITDD